MGLALHATVVPETISGVAIGRSRIEQDRAVFIQTTGILHPGNSGGPLVQLDSGEAVGMLVHTVPYMERARDRDGKSIGSVVLKTGISYSIPAHVIRQWLQANNLTAGPGTLSPSPRKDLMAQRSPAHPVPSEGDQLFATAHLVHTIAAHLGNDADLLTLAIRHYEAASALRRDAPWITVNLGLAYAALGQWKNVRAAYEAALEHNAEDPVLFTDMGHLWQQVGQIDQATRAYQNALVIDPCNFPARNNLGVLLNQLGRLDESIRAFRQAFDCEPRSAEAAYNLGLALAANGQRTEALHTMEQYIKDAGMASRLAPMVLSNMHKMVVKLKSLSD
jgi:Flp pilus assembly protein TadD